MPLNLKRKGQGDPSVLLTWNVLILANFYTSPSFPPKNHQFILVTILFHTILVKNE